MAYRTQADGQEVIHGYVFLTSDLPPEQFGYSGPIEALVGMRPDGTLRRRQAYEIYASAYNASSDSRQFYEFLKTMESFSETFDEETWVVLSTKGDFYKYLVADDGR